MFLLLEIFDLAFAVTVILAMTGTGSFVMKLFPAGQLPALERFLFSFGLGFGIFGLTVFMSGLAGFMEPVFYSGLLTVGIVLLAADRAATVKPLMRFFSKVRQFNGDPFSLFLILSAVLFLILNTFASMAPISSMDALNAHYALPKEYIRAGRIIHIEGNYYAHLAQLSEMVNMLMISLRSDVSGAILNSFFGPLSALAVFAAAKRFFPEKTALLTASLFFCSALVTWEATGSFIELHLAFFCILSLLGASIFYGNGRLRFALLSGSFLGLAFSTKIFAAGYFPVVTSVFIVALAFKAAPRVRVIKSYIVFLLAALLFGGPWYLLNMIRTGNPFFPLLFRIFGGTGWSSGTDREFYLDHSAYGTGKSVTSFVLTPLIVGMRGFYFDYGELIGPLILIFAPFAFLSRSAMRQRTLLLVFVFEYYLLWFFGSQQARFLVPVLPLCILLALFGAEELTARGKWAVAIAVKTVLVSFIIFNLAVVSIFASRFFGVVAGAEEKNTFLERMVVGYAHVEWMNGNLSRENDKVLFGGSGQYYLDIPYVLGNDGVNGIIDYHSMDGGKALSKKMKSLGITHVYIFGDFSPTSDTEVWEDFEKCCLTKIYEVRRLSPVKRSVPDNKFSCYGRVWKIK